MPKPITRIVGPAFLIALFMLTSVCLGATDLNGKFVRERDAQVLPQSVADFVTHRDGSTARIWVFFTDKGFTSKSAYESAASSVVLTERAMKRRAKVGLDHVVFEDLPVNSAYVDQIEALGGKHRRSSRWLNAASFEVSSEDLQTIADLPFVARIRPIAGFTPPESEIVERPLEESSASLANNYGDSYGQLSQIDVPAMHDMGYTGEGVVLAILDAGCRTTHDAFQIGISEGRLLAQWDFVDDDGVVVNQAGDASNEDDHGTYVLSAAAGEADGFLYGPAYKSSWILCKTEDVLSETPVEEDNWVAALEFVDSIGTDVINTSLGYSDWYTFEDMDGATATITIAANTCASRGIVLVNSAGNAGPSSGSISAPADAFDMLAVGAVSSTGSLASFSSRGPTFDGRTKPEVCARGVSVRSASGSSDNGYTYVSGTSLSSPLTAGVACLLVEAHPNWTPYQVREALMQTASQASSPTNSFGWGIISATAALSYGAEFTASVTEGDAPASIEFTHDEVVPVTSRLWDFGDGNTSSDAQPNHLYTTPGQYTVSLTVQTAMGEFSSTRFGYIRLRGDTCRLVVDSAFAGHPLAYSIEVFNSQTLEELLIPIHWADGGLELTYDSVTRGERTMDFEGLILSTFDPGNNRMAFRLAADVGGGTSGLEPGDGEVLKVFFTPDRLALGGESVIIDSSAAGDPVRLTTGDWGYSPNVIPGSIITKQIQRGDADYSNDGVIDIGDLTYIINYLFLQGADPITVQAGDFNADLTLDIGDLNGYIEYLFLLGDAPVNP